MTVEAKKEKPRRSKGDGSLYRKRNGRIWFMAYQAPDGTRHQESTGTDRWERAMRLLRKRVGARENNLPVIQKAERVTFEDAKKMVLDDFTANGKRSLKVVQRRIEKHLEPSFRGRRLLGITKADITAYVAKRQTDAIVTRKAQTVTEEDGSEREIEATTKPVSNGEINRELQILKRMFNLAI